MTRELGPTVTRHAKRRSNNLLWECHWTIQGTQHGKREHSTHSGTLHPQQEMSYIGGINYDKARLQETTAHQPSGKGKK